MLIETGLELSPFLRLSAPYSAMVGLLGIDLGVLGMLVAALAVAFVELPKVNGGGLPSLENAYLASISASRRL
jgi:hypothetical protein